MIDVRESTDKLKILIVDDNEDVLFALNLLLEPYAEKIKVAVTPDRIAYVSAQNLFTITSYSGYDPELGIDTIGADLESNVDRGQYPQSKSYSFGVNLVF